MLQSIRSARSKVAAGTLAAWAFASQALAEVPSEITDMTSNASTVFTTVKGIVVGVVGFMILIGFVKMVKKR